MANKKISELPYINGGKISGNTLVPLVTYFSATTGDTVHTYIDDFQTYLISGLTGNTDVFVTGGTYSNGDAIFTNNTGGTFTVTGFYTGETSYVNSLTTGVGLSADTTTGDITIINTDPDQVVVLNNGTNINVTGTYPNFTIDVTGLTDFNTFTTGFTYSNNTFTITDNSGSTFNATFNDVTGLTVNGDLNITGTTYSNVISATTYQNLPDNVTGNYLPLSGGTVTGNTIFTSGLSANTISATTLTVNGINITGDTYVTGLTFNTGNYNLTIGRNDGVSFTDSLAILASDLTVTGGTYDPNTGEATFTNNTGGTFTVTGFLTGFTDTYVTGGTYNNGTATFTNTSGGTFNVSGFYTGDTTTITGATSVGTGVTIFDSVVDRDIKINSITGDTLEKITTSLSANTIQVGINEQNLTLWDLVVQGNRLLSGNVSYISGLTFSVSPLEYLINGTIYDITSATTVTLNSGDSTYDRIDVIFADISGNTGVLEGTPSENPEKPIVDGDTQVEVTFVLVPANSTTADINAFIIYNENSGPPSEWTFGAGGAQPTRISGDSTDTAYSGVTSIKVSGVTGAYTTFFRLTGNTTLDTNEYATLQFAIKNLSANTTTSRIRLRFLSTGGTQNGNAVFMNSAGSSGYVQYSSTNTSTWQLISIPLWRFYLTNTNVQVLEVAFYPIGTGAQARYYFDLIEFVEGTASSPPSNSWTKIKGDGATTITAPNPNATLTISGGTNIGSFISGTSTVVLNLDNNINLNGLTANTISATTYQNLPTDVNVTGGTFSAGTITFTNNTGGTFNVTGLTTGSTSTISGDYLPLSGGTVTGATSFTNGLTANTISATTYQNLPDNVTGRYLPLSGGTVTGQTFFVSGVTISGDTNIVDPFGNVSVDTTSRILYNNGGINTINWDSGLLYDYNTTLTSVDFTNRTLNDSGGNVVVDWVNLELTDSTNVSINWSSRVLSDINAGPSVEWGNRKLYKSGGTISFDWENGILTGQTNIQSSTISATTYQNLPDNVTGLYLPLSGGTVTGSTNFTNGLSANTISATTIGNSGDCVDDIYISNIHSCLPLNINPLDEGNVYFGSTSGITVDVTNKRIGINNSNPQFRLDVLGSYGRFYNELDLTGFTITRITGQTSGITYFSVDSSDIGGIALGVRGKFNTLNTEYGKSGDSFIRSSVVNNGINIISASGTTTEDYIRFYAGRDAQPSNTPDIHIQGSGSTRGYIGINNSNPQFRLDVSGTTSRFFTDLDSATEQLINISSQTTSGITYTLVSSPNAGAISMGIRGVNQTLNPGFGKAGDSFIYSSTVNNGLNIISDSGSGTDDYIRFYAGQTASSGNAPDIHIQGTGSTRGFVGIGTTSPRQKLDVAGNAIISSGLTAQTGVFSSNTQNILTVIGSGNSTTSPLFSVQGSSGELFSVTDSLTGSLFSVNDISGLPIMEVFSDNTILWGSYQAPSLNTTVRISAGTGSTTIYTIPQSGYTGAFFEYTVSSSAGARSGSIMSVFSGNTVQYTETTTNDIGSTTGLTFSMSANSTNALLLASGVTAGWTVKTIIRSI